MFDEKTILARLQNGEDIQKIANEMAELINSANQTFLAAEAKKRAEAEAKKQHEANKRIELDTIIQETKKWMNKYYKVDDAAWAGVNAETVIELIESVRELGNALDDLGQLLTTPEIPAAPAPVGTAALKKTESADDALNKFIKKMGW